MKIVFMGTPDFAVPVLEALIRHHDVAAVYTRAPKESGRGKKINKSPVHLLAEKHGIDVRTPKTLKNDDEQNYLRGLNADAAIVAAYGLLLPQAVLDMFPAGCINVHASLLPRWRGAAPIQRAVEAGDRHSGISIMQMVQALDAGDVLAQEAVDISAQMSGGDLYDRLTAIGAPLLIKTLENLSAIVPQRQDETLATYAPKLEKAECLLDFDADADTLYNKIRAFAPYPATYFIYQGERFKVYRASVTEAAGRPGEITAGQDELVIATRGGKALRIETIQREGKQAMATADLLKGFHFQKGTCV